MDRRAFLTLIASVGAVSAAASIGVEILVPPAPVVPSGSLAPLTYKMLMESYAECTYGRDEPSLILMSPNRFLELHKLISITERCSNPEKRGITNLRMMGADVCPDPTMNDGFVRMVNENSTDQKLSRAFPIV